MNYNRFLPMVFIRVSGPIASPNEMGSTLKISFQIQEYRLLFTSCLRDRAKTLTEVNLLNRPQKPSPKLNDAHNLVSCSSTFVGT